MEKIALLYAPAKGSTEKVAKMIQEKLGENKVEMILIDENVDVSILIPYSKIIMGISTVGRDSWDSKYTQVGWDYFLPKLEKADLKSKTIALFGLGDHILYSDSFVDSMGRLAQQLIKSGAEIIGQTPTEAYTYSDSEAIFDKKFIGLPLDEDNEPELTEQRVELWIKSISGKIGN